MRIEKINNIELRCCDCMEYMRSLPDNAFDLAIVDPPYGMGWEEVDVTRAVIVVMASCAIEC